MSNDATSIPCYSDYHLEKGWKDFTTAFTTYAQRKGFGAILSGAIGKPIVTADETSEMALHFKQKENQHAWINKNDQLIGIIKTAMGDEYADEIDSTKNATEIWKSLTETCNVKDASISTTLSSTIQEITLGDDTVKKYASRIKSMAERIVETSPDGGAASIPISLQLSYFYNGLPICFKEAIERSTFDKSVRTWAQVISEFERVETWCIKNGTHGPKKNAIGKAAAAKTAGGKKGKYALGSCKSHPEQTSHNDDTCYQQHPELAPWYKKKEGGSSQTNENKAMMAAIAELTKKIATISGGEKAAMAKIDKELPEYGAFGSWGMMAVGTTSLDIAVLAMDKTKDKDDTMYLDSGATMHMVHTKKVLQGYKKLDKPIKIIVGNNEFVEAVGLGYMQNKTIEGNNVKINSVYHVPGLAMNLLSVSAFNQQGLAVTFPIQNTPGKSTQAVLVEQDGTTMFTATNNGGMYTMDGFEVGQNKHSNVDCALGALAHQRFGHLSPPEVKKALKMSSYSGNKADYAYIQLQFCKTCAKAKHNKRPFQLSEDSNSPDKPGDVIVSDIKGPFPVQTQEGYRYYITFIDLKTRYVTVYLLRKKSDALKAYKEFKSLFENFTNKSISKIKVFRTDNGGEYTSIEFETFLAELGTQHQTTIPYTPEQNGVSERYNSTIMGKVRCMFIEGGFPEHMWGELVMTSVYLINRSPTSHLDHMTPHEAMFKRKPDITNLRVIGSTAYALNTDPTIKTLEDRAIECVLVGYLSNQKGWRLYDPVGKKMIHSRSVRFNEREMWYHTTHPTMPNEIAISTWFTPNAWFPKAEQENADPEEDEENDTSLEDSIDEVYHEANIDIVVQGEEEPQAGPMEGPDEQSDGLNGKYWSEQIPGRRHRALAARIVAGMRKPVSRSALHRYHQALASRHNELDTPNHYVDARNHVDDKLWKVAEQEEFDSLTSMGALEWCTLPPGKKAIGSRWTYKTKLDTAGNIARRKARWVARGFSQIHGQDFHETFSPTAKMASIRCCLALAAKERLIIKQMDVETAFLTTEVEEEVYIQPPEGFISPECIGKVCRLRRSLYGLKQSGRNFYRKYDGILAKFNFTKSEADNSVYLKTETDGTKTIILLYVDDCLILASNRQLIDKATNTLTSEFKMTEVHSNRFVGIQWIRNCDESIDVHQHSYINEVIKKYKEYLPERPVKIPLSCSEELNSEQCPKTDNDIKLMKPYPYAAILGSLMFLMLGTRPDIAQAVSKLARFMANPGMKHWNALKKLLGYVSCTKELILKYKQSEETMQAFCDSDHASCKDTRRSTTGYVVLWQGSAISWRSQRQSTVSTSSTQAEYIALSEAGREIIWLQFFLNSIGQETTTTDIKGDNDGAMNLAKDPHHHSTMKHLDVRVHIIREWVERRALSVSRVDTAIMVADSLTKPVPLEKTLFCRMGFGLRYRGHTD